MFLSNAFVKYVGLLLLMLSGIRSVAIWYNATTEVIHGRFLAASQLRFQPRHGSFLAAAAENIVSILDVETQASRHSLQNSSCDEFILVENSRKKLVN
ncbi:hypothetical protein Hanom_Chr04g00293841 [Helianthus anomalus]